MCIRISYKNGTVKLYDPSEDMESQIQDIESVEIEGRITKKEKEMIVFLAMNEALSGKEKIEKKIEEIETALREAKKEE